MAKVEPKVGVVVPNVEDPNVGSWALVCPKPAPNPEKPVAVVAAGVAPNAVPKPVAKIFF